MSWNEIKKKKKEKEKRKRKTKERRVIRKLFVALSGKF